MSTIVTVTARFVDKTTNQPLSGDQYLVKVYDSDILEDDYLGESKLTDGGISVSFDIAKVQSADSPGEEKPDIYFVLYENDQVKFQSGVFDDVELLKDDPVTGDRVGLAKDFGIFRI